MVNIANKSILIIDDMPTMCSIIKAIVQSMGALNIDMSYSAADAIRRLAMKTYDIILCDYHLGAGMNGQQILEQGKAHGFIRAKTCFLMITAEKSKGMVLAALEYRPDGYVVKPFTKNGIAETLERTLAYKEDIAEINQAIERGDIESAILACGEKIKTNPENSLEYFKIQSNLLMESGLFKEARGILENIVSRHEIPWAVLALAKSLVLEKKYLDAKPLLCGMIEKNPNQVECYDWLSRIHVELDDPVKAQQILEAGTKISSYSVARKKAFATLALDNGDIARAVQGIKELIALSKNSIYNVGEDVIRFARTLSLQGFDQDARDILRAAKFSIKANLSDHLRIAIINSKAAYKDKNRAAAVAYLNEAKKHHKALGDEAEDNDVLQLAENSLLIEDLDYAKRISEDFLRKHRSDIEICGKLKHVFVEFGLSELFIDVSILAGNDESAINKRGIELFKRKRYREAVELFERAVAADTEDITITLNAVQAMIACIREGIDSASLTIRARSYLDRTGKSNDNAIDDRHSKLMAMLDELSRTRY